MTQARHGSAPRRIEVEPACGIREINTTTRDGDGRRHAQIAVEDVRHREIAGTARPW
jgi:hypothetical protein